jgi:hypothetical protein
MWMAAPRRRIASGKALDRRLVYHVRGRKLGSRLGQIALLNHAAAPSAGDALGPSPHLGRV